MSPITDMLNTAVPGKYLISTAIVKMHVSHIDHIISLLKHILLVAWSHDQYRTNEKRKTVARKWRTRAFSIRLNIPVWNSGYSMRRMEPYFPFCWTNPSQVIRIQVSREITKSNGGLFYLCFTRRRSSWNKRCVGEGDNITFIVRIKRSPRLH